MDVMLGVSVMDADARITLLDATPPHDVIDQSGVVLTGESLETLISTLVSTDRVLAESGHRVVATRVCGTNAERMSTLVDALVDADLTDVTAVPQPDAVAAVVRSLASGKTVASLSSEGDTAALSIIDSETDTTSLIAVETIDRDDQGSAYRTLLERFSEEPGGATSVIVLGAPTAAQVAEMSRASAVPLQFPDEPEFVVARGAALASLLRRPTSGVSTPESALDTLDTMLGPQSPQLAYSAVDDTGGFDGEYEYDAADVPMQTPMRPLSAIDPQEVETDGTTAVRPRMLLVGSTVAAIVVVGFAALAVSVAISIRPTASQQAIRMQQETLSGKYFPVAPGQGVAPDGSNWTAVENVPPPGVDTGGVRTFETKALNFSGGGADTLAPKVIQIYPDGTVGVPDPQGFVPVPPVAADAFNPDLNSAIPDFVPRLIPDLSKVNMNQVITVLGNLQENTANPLRSTGTTRPVVPLDQLGNPNTGLNLSDLGVTTGVRSNRGALFNTDQAKSAAPGVGTIPTEIFQNGKAGVDVTQALPPDTKVLESLPVQDTGKPGGKPVFGGVITDLDAVTAKPGTSSGAARPEPGSAPSVITDSVSDMAPKPDVPQQLPGGFSIPELSPSKPVAPQQSPVGDSPPELSPSAPDVRQQSPVSPPQSDSAPQFPSVVPWPKVTPQKPDVSPSQQGPEVVAPPVKVDPPVSDPEPVVKAPPPIINLPFPSFRVPSPVAPVSPVGPAEEAPSAPAVPVAPQLPLLPQLPVVGGLFGSN